MFSYEVKEQTAPIVDNGNAAKLVEVVQRLRGLTRQQIELDKAILSNGAEIAKTSGMLQEMIRMMYQEDEVVKYLADAIVFVLDDTKGRIPNLDVEATEKQMRETLRGVMR